MRLQNQLKLNICRRRRGSAISKDLQAQLLETTVKAATEIPFDWRNLSYSFWLARSIRYLDLKSIPPYYQRFRFARVEYLFRHRPDSEWIWQDSPEAELIRQVVEPFQDIFDHMTRIKVHVQKAGEAVTLHRDLSAGQIYSLRNPLSTEVGPHQMAYQMYPFVKVEDFPFAHRPNEQVAMSLKIPLSSHPEFYGRQFILDDGIHHYTSEGDIYLLNENNPHGSEAVPYLRGLVFVDGIMNLEKAAERFPDALPATPFKKID